MQTPSHDQSSDTQHPNHMRSLRVRRDWTPSSIIALAAGLATFAVTYWLVKFGVGYDALLLMVYDPPLAFIVIVLGVYSICAHRSAIGALSIGLLFYTGYFIIWQ